MNIELRNIKYAAFASQETSCFNAVVYIDGARAGEVSNGGHGGCNLYHPHALQVRLDAYGKTLPPLKSEYFEDGLEQDADLLIGELLDTALAARDLARLLKSKLVFARGGKIYTTKKIDAPTLALLLDDSEATRAKYKADALLNAMPADAALALYLSGG